MKTYIEKLPELLTFIESGNGIAKKNAKKELEKMAKEADKVKISKDFSVCEKCGTVNYIFYLS